MCFKPITLNMLHFKIWMSQLIMTLFYNSDRYFAVHSIFTYTLSLADIASPIDGLYTAFLCSICGVLSK